MLRKCLKAPPHTRTSITHPHNNKTYDTTPHHTIGDAEGSYYSTEQLEQRARIPHLHANRYRVDTAEDSNQKGRPPHSVHRNPHSSTDVAHSLAERTRVRPATLAAVRLTHARMYKHGKTIHRVNQIDSLATFIHQR